MTRQFKIISMEPEGSERTLIVTTLSNPRVPTTLDPGRETIVSVHDACEAVIVSKRLLKDIDDPLFNVEILRDDPKSLNELAKENAELKARIAMLEVEAAAAPQTHGLTPEQMAMIDAVEGRGQGQPLGFTVPAGGFNVVHGDGDPAGGPNAVTHPHQPVGGDPPRALDPAVLSGRTDGHTINRSLMADASSNSPTVINDAGDTAPQPNDGKPEQAAMKAQQAEIDAREKLLDEQTAAVNPGTQGDELAAETLERAEDNVEKAEEEEWSTAAPAGFAPEPEPAPVFPTRKSKPAPEPTEF